MTKHKRERSPAEVEFNARLGAIKRQRDDELRTANVEYGDGLARLRAARTRARTLAYHNYEEAHGELRGAFAEKLPPLLLKEQPA